MLLQRLSEYADRLALPPPMYIQTPIRWLLDLDAKGRLLQWVPTIGEGRTKDRGKRFLAPHAARTVAIRAKLLADNGEYVLGLGRDRDKRTVKKVAQRHADFVRVVAACAKATKEPTVRAVQRFLEQHAPDDLRPPRDFDPSNTLTFRVNGVLPIDLPTVRTYWASVTSAETGDHGQTVVSGKPLECVVCGHRRPGLKRHPFKIKRIPGGQPSGMALISANANAFESYGLEESLIAPTCRECAERFAKAANALLEGEATHLTIGPLVYLFWTKEATTFSPVAFLTQPDPEQVKALLASAWEGRERGSLDARAFYATALSASGGRVVVRDWLETTVGQAMQSLARYFALQRLVGPDGAAGRPLKLYTLAASLYRDATRELVPQIPRLLLRVALHGGSLPDTLLFQAVTRGRAEQRMTHPRAALIKMVLCSGAYRGEEDTMSELNARNTDPAYLCGRLLAELEAIQRVAIPGANTTLVDRFYGTASSAPASVFGHLIRGAQHHLGKLRKDRRPTYLALQARLEEIQRDLPAFPPVLTLAQQGLFALGYYHQRAADRAAAIARGEAKKAAGLESQESDG